MAGEKILIVDDEKSMCQFLSIMLRKEGYQITAVHNGKKALDQFKVGKFDLVITDIRMSGMDGIELLSELKKVDQAVPVIIMTAYASQKTAIDAVNHGAFPLPHQAGQKRRDQDGRKERIGHEACPSGEHEF